MKATCAIMRKNLGKHQVLETFWQLTRTQHESNMRNHAQKPGKTPGS